MTAIISLVTPEIWAAIVAGAIALLSVFTLRRQGKKQAQSEYGHDAHKRAKDGRNAAKDEKRATGGLSDSDVRDRVRRRDSDWRGL